MFESAEIGHRIDKATWDEQVPTLRAELLAAQYELKQRAGFRVLILINGIEGAGKGETIRLLNEWLDPRLVQVHAFVDATDDEQRYPAARRFWQDLPPRGRMGVFFGNWYSQLITLTVRGKIEQAQLDQAIGKVERFERMLCDEGTLLFKFWFHLGKAEFKQRIDEQGDDPLQHWRASPLDWHKGKTYSKVLTVAEHLLRQTSRDYAPWYVLDGSDANYRSLTVGRMLLQGLRARLDQQQPARAATHAAPLAVAQDGRRLLNELDLSQTLSKSDYKKQLQQEQQRLAALVQNKAFRTHGLVAVFEGNDAAGKGGAIRRVSAALDPRQYQIIPVAAPTDEELAQPYLWRFWRHVPGHGSFTLFDRSWYGRVLVERVEGFCSEADWLRAYNEINDFEQDLTEHGLVVVKFWLSIDQETQLARFRERENVPYKRFKITEDDWRNRDKWPQYVEAVSDMVDRTSTREAPWTLVEANDKRFARVKVLRTINDQLEQRLSK
ncbi:polyphosphate:AMP phosphotransferase [Atopomonas sediminilitoris]|uniref:polyphosphate:AMP phosphotransferase n=1 Tax=Atopomonas sediminilitoris TaxID=2919919 RepID=UPI001F4F04AA|nr:polyphosphate:AMP phosphotransferase [Atopomonas sediminilitoris]MCJ8169137.1 polyphosphate:AMP phosphotransferase [Atopomonas sediminilitoris]